MMWQYIETTFLLVFSTTLFSQLVAYPYPADNADSKSDEVIFVPYDVKYVPIEIPAAHAEDLQKNLNHKEESTLSVFLKSKEQAPKKKSPVLLKDKFELDEAKPPEDYVLVPLSVLKQLDKSNGHGNSDGRHIAHSKDELSVNGPEVEVKTVSRSKRRVQRPPPLVGYLNGYDLFPTVA